VAAKALVKLQKAAEAVPLLQAAARFDAAAARAEMGLTLAQLAAGDAKKAEEALDRALQHNPHMGKAILGQLKKSVDNPAAALPGTREEAAFYAQSFGDAWDDTAKDFLRSAIDKRTTAATT
jgi:lipopolysaccharide biosynthesis regulator YciM